MEGLFENYPGIWVLYILHLTKNSYVQGIAKSKESGLNYNATIKRW
jgi:hypothetical protein